MYSTMSAWARTELMCTLYAVRPAIDLVSVLFGKFKSIVAVAPHCPEQAYHCPEQACTHIIPTSVAGLHYVGRARSDRCPVGW